MKINRTMKSLLLSVAVAAFWCADLAAQEVVAAESASTADDDLTAGYRFVKSRPNGDWYIDYRAMGEEARNDDHFAALAERFIAADSALGVEDIQVLYYGRAYRDDYAGGYGLCADIGELIDAQCYDEAFDLCVERRKSDPASPCLLRLLHEAASKKSRPATERELSDLERSYEFVLNVISYSGNGTMLAPYMVAAVEDEYEFMINKLGITEIQMQQRVAMDDGTQCDIITVAEGEGSDSENDEVWFNVDMPSAVQNKSGENK